MIESARRGGLTVWLRGNPRNWDLERWSLTPVLERWSRRNRQIHLAINRADLRASDELTRRSFVRWSDRVRASLVQADPRDDDRLYAVVKTYNRRKAWASAHAGEATIGPVWGARSEDPVVSGYVTECASQTPINVDDLLVEDKRESIIELRTELDGPIDNFGLRFREQLLKSSPDIARVFSQSCTSIDYSDRYLFSPLSVRLVFELLAAFADERTEIRVTTYGQRPNSQSRRPAWIFDDWPDLRVRDEVLRRLLRMVAPRSLVYSSPIVQHRRILDFRTPIGTGTIYLDQGVGSWRGNRVEFDHGAAIEEQIKQLTKRLTIRNTSEGTYAAIRISS